MVAEANRFSVRRFVQPPMRRGNMCRRIRGHAPTTGVSMSASGDRAIAVREV